MCSYYYNPKLGLFSPYFLYSFPSSSSQDIFSCAEEEAVLLKRKPVVDWGGGGACGAE